MKTNNIDVVISFINNPNVREKLKKSRSRIEKSFDELFLGYKLDAKDVLNEVVKVKNYSGVVEVNEINFYSFCEHHFLPFYGTCKIIYEPNTIITGLGKIVRLVRDVHAKRLQIQEIMTKNIAEDIMNFLNAKGVYVETVAKHLCICSRGPKDDSSATVVRYGVGTLKSYYGKKS